MEVIGAFDSNYFNKVVRVKAVWNGFQKDWEELNRRQTEGYSLEEFYS